MSTPGEAVNSSKIKQVVNQEFDLEILLKNKDLKLVEQEIGKTEAQLTALRSQLENQEDKKGRANEGDKSEEQSTIEPNEFSKKYVELLSVYRKDNDTQTNNDPNAPFLTNNSANVSRSGSADGLQYGQNALNGSQFCRGANAINNGNATDSKKKGNNGDSYYNDRRFDTNALKDSTSTSGKVYGSVSNGYMTTRSQSAALRPVVARMRPSTKSVQYRYQERNMCICRRSDKVLVSLRCHKCGKVDFLSPQSFINHCRIAHEIEIKDADQAAMKYGTLLPKEEQDDEGLKALENLEKQGLDPALNLNKGSDYSDDSRFNSSSGVTLFPAVESLENVLSRKRRKVSNSSIGSSKDNMKYSHLKAMIGDKVDGFDELVVNTTESMTDAAGLDDE